MSKSIFSAYNFDLRLHHKRQVKVTSPPLILAISFLSQLYSMFYVFMRKITTSRQNSYCWHLPYANYSKESDFMPSLNIYDAQRTSSLVQEMVPKKNLPCFDLWGHSKVIREDGKVRPSFSHELNAAHTSICSHRNVDVKRIWIFAQISSMAIVIIWAV